MSMRMRKNIIWSAIYRKAVDYAFFQRTCVADLRGKSLEELYILDCQKKGFQEDRCQLYVFRCAVYYAEHEEHDPEKLKWWYWQDKECPEISDTSGK